jgi:hypothetical protein
MRLRAINIREAALGFNDDVSRTLIELAEDLERKALALEGGDDGQPTNDVPLS